ncbi:MAG: OmpA family protein [Cyclobacteriaceae bacterium]|nr:OmpA family protein [Cyclobacteriaceae bacterium]
MFFQPVKAHFFILITLLSTVFAQNTHAQKQKKKFKQGATIQLNDSVTSFSQSDIFAFQNVNKVSFYYDGAKIKKLQELKAEGPTQKYYDNLKSYVRNFGMQNFHENTAMLWELAKLSKQFGQPGESILLYKLILKHHRQGLNIQDVYREYDSLERDKKKYYVPLEYYYQLVDYRKEIDTLHPPHSVLVNMGDDLNSKKEDYGPTIGNVDNLILFTSKRNKHQQGERSYDEDLFFSTRMDGYWGPAKEFKLINTSYNEGSACLSHDGKYMVFSRCNTPESSGNCDLYSAEVKNDSVWTNIKNMGPDINSSGWDSHPSLTHQGDTLYFASNRVGSFGLSDIYFSVKDKKGIWGKAQNAGPVINTVNSEVSPFFHHTFNVLYFSSNGHPLNFGDFDIYKTTRHKNVWSEPKNIGPLVNGAGSEYYFTIDSKSKDLYYARSEEEDKKNLDLFSFSVPMEAQPEAVTQLKGTLKSNEGKPMKGIVSVIDLDNNVEVSPKFLREDGSFDFSLINKRNYLLIIQGDEFFRIEEIFFLNGDMEINKVAEPIESKIAFESLEFENGKANILEAMHSDLNKIANFLIDHPKLRLSISGHTDSDGKEDSNLKLSQARADAIKKYLVDEFKIDGVRIVAIGYGSAKPITQEITSDHKQLNRRVEFEIFN